MTGVPPPVDNPAAVHRGLLALARRRKADFNAILVQYAIERLIDRLSRSPHADSFVLKGAMLFRLWTGELQRPTKDVDFLGHGDPSPAAVAEAVTAIVSIDAKDGLRFDATSIAAQEIRVEHDYDGVRVTVTAYLTQPHETPEPAATTWVTAGSSGIAPVRETGTVGSTGLEQLPFPSGKQGVTSSCDAKCDAISANRIELLTRAVILVAGMNLAEAERAAVLARVIADLTSPTTRLPQ